MFAKTELSYNKLFDTAGLKTCQVIARIDKIKTPW